MNGIFADPFAPKKTKGRQPSALSVYPDLTPEDEDSLLSSLGSTTLGGLSMIGSILDTPGSWVRNTLSGRNPFQGTFDSSLRASGRDVLETYGLLNPNQEGFHPIDNPRDALGDVAGFGVEVALDPLSYVLGGARAVNAGGAAAAKLGVLPRAAYDAAINVPKKGLRGLGAKLFNRPLEESTQLLRTGAREARMTEDFTAAAGRYATEHAGDDINKVNAAIESAAQSVGKTSQELYDSKDPLGFLVGFGNPFSHKPAWFGIGKDTPIVGDAALKAAKFLDKGQDALRYSLPGRIGAQLFSKPAGMAISKPGQLSAGTMYDAERIAGETGLGQTSELATLSRKIGLPYDVEQQLLGKALEIPNPTNLPVTSLLTTAEQDLLGPNANLFDQLVSKYKDYVNSGYDVLKATGRNTPELRGRVPGVGAQVGDGVLPPMIDYAPRYAAIPDHYGSAGLGKKIFNQSADSTLQRSDELADIPRHVIDDLALDPTYKDVNRAVKKAAENVEFARRRWKEHTDPALKELARNELTLAERARDNAWEASDNMVLDKMGRSRADIDVWKSHLQSLEEGMRFSQQQGETIGADVLAQVAEYKRLIGQHREIGKTLTGLPDEAFGKPFWVHPLEAFARNVSQNLRAASASREMMKFATQFAEPGGKGIPLFDVLHGSKFAKGASPDITDRATQEAIFYLQAAGHETDALKRALHVAPDGTSLATDSDLLRHFTVPESIAGDMQRIIKGFKDPEVLKPSLEIIDWITSKFKTGVTTPWPSFFTRNFTQGTWQNFVIGAASKRWYQEAQRLISGEKPTAAILDLAVVRNAGIRNVDEAAEFLRRSFYQYNVSGQSFKNEITGGYKPIIENMRGNVPGMDGNNQTLGAAFSGIPAGIKEHAAGGESKIGKAWAKATAVPKAAIDAGAKMNTWSESLHRTAGYLSLLEQGFDPAVAAAKIRQAHVDYADLSDFEKVVMRRVAPFYCVPDECEILTRRGWSSVDDLVVGEEVLTMDHETGRSYWEPCEDKAIFDYDGILMKLEGSRDYFAFTPDHRWPVVSPNSTKAERRIVRGYDLRTNHKIPRVADFSDDGLSTVTPREAAIAGWIVTDGYQRRRDGSPNHQEMLIYQSPGKYLDEICNLLECDYTLSKPHPDTGVIAVRLVGELRKRMQQLLPSKESFMGFACHLSKKAAKACFDAMLKAEGSCANGKKAAHPSRINHFSQNPGVIRDAFQVVAQLAGYVVHKSNRGAYVSYRNETLKTAGILGHCQYKGRVWCPKTKHGTWLMRCRGRIIWTGNTWSRKMTPTVLKELYETPGGYSGQLAQLSSGLRGRDEGFLPDYLQGGLGMPINDQDETGKQTFLTNIDLAPEAVFEPLSMGPNAAKDTGLKLLGMMNPLIKAPLEAMTGRQFFTGRDMRDLHSTLGLPPALDQFLSNSPLARVKSTASQLGQMATGRKDPLTGLANTFTGLRFSDVDIPKHKSIKTRELIQDEMRREDGVGVFEKLYVPPEILKDLTPRQIALLKLYAIEQKRAADRRKAQKQP